MIVRRLIVHGTVQGVFYRAWTVEQARALGVTGWVRNRRDDTVEILACGGDEAVEALIARCRQGPPAAEVERIDVEETDESCPSGFSTKPTL